MEDGTQVTTSTPPSCLKDWMNSHSRLEQLLATEEAARQANDSQTGSCVLAPWREKVTMWCYDVVDHLEEGRFVVYAAMNILDRYCATMPNSIQGEASFEVAAMTALFLAVRISGSGSLKLPQLCAMSRRGVRVQDIVTTGTTIVKALNWDHRIITPFDITGAILELVPVTNRKRVEEMSGYLMEVSVCDTELSKQKPSSVALAALLCAVNMTLSSKKETEAFSKAIEKVMGVSTSSSSIQNASERLLAMYRQSAESLPSPQVPVVIDDDDEGEQQSSFSPRTVVARSVSTDDLVALQATTTTTPTLKRSISAHLFQPKEETPLKRTRRQC